MPKLDTIEQIQKLEQTLHSIEAVQSRLTPKQLTIASLNRGRTPIEILAHVRSCADIWSYSIYAILATKEEPILAQINTHQWTASLGYTKHPFTPSFQIFRINRLELLSVLRAVTEDSWQKTAIIGDRQHSVYSQVKRMTLHEVSHCKELESIAQMHG